MILRVLPSVLHHCIKFRFCSSLRRPLPAIPSSTLLSPLPFSFLLLSLVFSSRGPASRVPPPAQNRPQLSGGSVVKFRLGQSNELVTWGFDREVTRYLSSLLTRRKVITHWAIPRQPIKRKGQPEGGYIGGILCLDGGLLSRVTRSRTDRRTLRSTLPFYWIVNTNGKKINKKKKKKLYFHQELRRK